jgi:hypothetical protein
MELRLFTFADLLPDRQPGNHQYIKDLTDEIVLAYRLWLDAVSSPVIPGAAASVILSIKYEGQGPNQSW